MPQESQTGKRQPNKIVNIVHNDEIWKDHILHENDTARRGWPEQWGYLVHEYRKLNFLMEGRPMSGRTSAEDRNRTKVICGGLVLPQIPERQKGFPRTTYEEIGWKSKVDGPNVMVTAFGEKKKGRCTLTKRLKWPRDCF